MTWHHDAHPARPRLIAPPEDNKVIGIPTNPACSEYIRREELGTFVRVIRLSDEGIEFRKRPLVRWSEVVAFRAFPDFLLDRAYSAIRSPFPRLILYLRDGRIFVIPGSGLRTRQSAEGIRPFEQIPNEFDELVGEVSRRGVARWQGPREEAVVLGTAFAFMATTSAVGFAALGWLHTTDAYAEAAGIAGILAGVCGVGVGFLLARMVRMRFLKGYAMSKRDATNNGRKGPRLS